MSLRALYDLPAPAKLNIFLHIIGQRADGYHLLQSPFVLIDWADTLHFERRDDGRLQRHDLGPALPEDDLCLRAARALQSASGSALGVDISIHKHVPAGAGMGGGSSDAATTLLALNRLWGLRWPRARLAEIGLKLGADVPFFVGGHNAFVEGIGERLTPLNWPEQHFAVVKPPQALATREIFSHPALKRNSLAVIVKGCFEGAGSSGVPACWLQDFGKNDLQPAAEDLCAEVAEVARWLEQRWGNSRMTGSGSAVFSRTGTAKLAGVSDTTDAKDTADASAGLQDLPPSWLGRMCRSLLVHPLGAWAD